MQFFRNMTLLTTSVEIIKQLKHLVGQLSEEQYTRKIDVLSSNTIGKHIRHIVEFYECLMKGIPGGVIDYDARERNLNLETDTVHTKHILDGMLAILEDVKEDQPLTLAISYSDSYKNRIQTTLYRELAYNIEHAVHHFAIISIAIKQEFPMIKVDPNFGIAYSTVKYQESQQCAQ